MLFISKLLLQCDLWLFNGAAQPILPARSSQTLGPTCMKWDELLRSSCFGALRPVRFLLCERELNWQQ